ncbi:hypothetical protein Tco_1119292, partial [Tanacetum coccineum]
VSFGSDGCISSSIGMSLVGCSDWELGFCFEELEGAYLVSEDFQAEDV